MTTMLAPAAAPPADRPSSAEHAPRCACGATLRNNDDWCWLCYEPRRHPVVTEEPSPAPDHPPYDPTIPTTAILAVVLVAIAHGIGLYLGRYEGMEPARYLHVSLLVVLGTYGIVSILVLGRAAISPVAPRWTIDSAPWSSVAVGLLCGSAAAGFLLGLTWLGEGRLASDTWIVLLLSEGGWQRTAAVAFVLVVMAPLVEEVLFRGLLLETLRRHGTWVALAVSAGGFAVWHLEPSLFRYYLFAGLFLGAVYLRFGLSGSIAAHAAFNGVLVLAALVALGGAPQTLDASGLRLELPRGWAAAERPEVFGYDVLASGPSGAALTVESFATLGEAVDVETLADVLPLMPTPSGLEVEPSSIRVVDHHAGPAVRMTVRIEGRRADTVVFASSERLWFVTLVGAGSPRAHREFEQMLTGLTFSPLPAAA